MSRYAGEIDLENPNNSQTELAKMIRPGTSVLDVGCAAGDLARAAREIGCSVRGVDIDADAAEAARPLLDELVIANIDESPLSEHFEAGAFDAIVFGDVLEHLWDPGAALRDARSLLAPGGRVLISVPNVTHGAVRLALLQGRWQYTPTGLLDATHVRFFTRKNFLELLDEAGYVLEELGATVLDPFQTEVDIDAATLPSTIVEWVRHQPDALYYQFLASARLRAEDEERVPAPDLLPVLPHETGRLRDSHTEQMEAEQAERHRLLTLRDHLIGLEASLAAAKRRVRTAQERADKAERQLKELRRRTRREREDEEGGGSSVARRAVRKVNASLRGPREQD